jgi:hypothetical protein
MTTCWLSTSADANGVWLALALSSNAINAFHPASPYSALPIALNSSIVSDSR